MRSECEAGRGGSPLLAPSPCLQPTPFPFRGSQEPGFCHGPWASGMRGAGRAWGPWRTWGAGPGASHRPTARPP